MRKGLIAVLTLVFGSYLFAQQTMNNDAIIKLVKASLSEDLIVSTINSSTASFDTSAEGIIALKAAGVTDKEIAAMVAKAAAPTVPAAAATASALPPGIDEVGVYYKDKKGAWMPLLPEVVNFKSGGVLKGMATGGMVKGDINGHIQGKQAKTQLTFPAVLAVYVPEGTAATEYQMLRLRESGNAREFRSVTGGVYHSSGGATRDAVQFEPTKIAPRVYQITLDQNLGKGEYGLLPPGSSGNSGVDNSGKVFNSGATTKIYSISIIE